MAKKQKGTPRTTLEEVNESLSTAAQRIEANKKYIYYALIAIAAIVLLVMGYIYGIRNPNLQKAKDGIGKADMTYMQGDTTNALKEYEKVFDSYSNKPAERAAFNSAIILYQQGKNKEAAQYLEKYESNGKMVGPASQSLLGDCYVNMKQYDKAIVCYDKAVKLSNENVFFTPTFMIKKANVLHAQGKYSDEAAIYQNIKDNYMQYTQAYQFNVDKYLERAKALSEKK
ncbi:MAG: tetratricopeptide repeat protein [Muribaculaceae bacterium]|nr:tetratricopeptide repeat protein [Muribaculaceae bacterium]